MELSGGGGKLQSLEVMEQRNASQENGRAIRHGETAELGRAGENGRPVIS